MTCKLCNQEVPLIKKSHILPEFLFKKFFDQHGKLRKFDTVQMAKGNPRISKPSSGSYEGKLLCNDCDNRIIGQYETYISRVLNKTLPLEQTLNCKTVKNFNGINFIEIQNLDYKKTKLFLLSILFRAHISTNKEFNEVSLGKYAEEIRDIIYNGKIINDLELQISIMKFPDNSDFNSFIGQPIRRKIDATTMYSIIINGFLILFFLKENGISKRVENVRLKIDNSITLIEVPEKLVGKFILTYMGIK